MIETIKRMINYQRMLGNHPTKVYMSRHGYRELMISLSDRMLKPPDECHVERVCGMEIEVRDELLDGVLYIIS